MEITSFALKNFAPKNFFGGGEGQIGGDSNALIRLLFALDFYFVTVDSGYALASTIAQ